MFSADQPGAASSELAKPHPAGIRVNLLLYLTYIIATAATVI